jgi:hypothetical protein
VDEEITQSDEKESLSQDILKIRVGVPEADEWVAQQLGISVEELRRPLEFTELWEVCRPAQSEAEKLHHERLYARLAVQARIGREGR